MKIFKHVQKNSTHELRLTAACEGAQNTWLGHLVILSLWNLGGWEGELDITMPKHL